MEKIREKIYSCAGIYGVYKALCSILGKEEGERIYALYFHGGRGDIFWGNFHSDRDDIFWEIARPIFNNIVDDTRISNDKVSGEEDEIRIFLQF